MIERQPLVSALTSTSRAERPVWAGRRQHGSRERGADWRRVCLEFVVWVAIIGLGGLPEGYAEPRPDVVGLKLGQGTLQEFFDLYTSETATNLILDDGVPRDRKVNITAESLPLERLFEVVLAANDLGSRHIAPGTYLVFPLAKAGAYRGKPEIRKFSLTKTAIDVPQLKQILAERFPGTQVYLDPKNLDTVLMLGAPDVLEQAGDFFSQISASLNKVKQVFVPLRNLDPTTTMALLKSLDPDTGIFESPGKNGLIISGNHTEELEALLRRIDLEPSQEIRVFEVTYQDLSKLAPLLQALDEKAKVLALGDFHKIVVQANGQTMALIERAIEAVDQPKKQVLFDLQLVEVDVEALAKLGVQLTQNGFTIAEIKGLIETKTYPLLLNLLKDEKSARILARPSLKVLVGSTGRVTIGDRIPLEVAATSQTESGAVLKFNTQLQWVDAGIKFIVEKVMVHRDNKTSLELKTEVSSVTGLSPKGHPILRTREAETSLLLGDGETAILAGLINREDRVTIAKVPYLSRLPLLGRIFQAHDRRRNNSEILLFVTAHVQHEPAEIATTAIPSEASERVLASAPSDVRRSKSYEAMVEQLRKKIRVPGR